LINMMIIMMIIMMVSSQVYMHLQWAVCSHTTPIKRASLLPP
jgi:hypothetical protein